MGEKAQERDALLLAHRGCDDRGSALLCAGLVFHTTFSAMLSQKAGETIAHWCLTCVSTLSAEAEAERHKKRQPRRAMGKRNPCFSQCLSAVAQVSRA